MRGEYFRIWTLEGFTVGSIDYGTKGTSHFWKLIKTYDNGDVIVERKGKRALLWNKDILAGARHTGPNWSYPLGLHFGIERGYTRTWYGKYRKETL